MRTRLRRAWRGHLVCQHRAALAIGRREGALLQLNRREARRKLLASICHVHVSSSLHSRWVRCLWSVDGLELLEELLEILHHDAQSDAF